MVKFFTFIFLILFSVLLFSCSEDNNIINVSNQDFVVMLPITAGAFEMGNIAGDPAEMPLHIVKITKDFYIGKYEITQSQFKTVMGYNPSNYSGKDNNPVENISWQEAIEFCNELSIYKKFNPCYTMVDDTVWVCDLTKNGYRLPTEAEWEYSCRAGSYEDYDNGSDEIYLDSISWYKTNSGSSTHPIGTKKANAFGLYDMHGNVSEMVWDYYYKYADSVIENPVGPASGMFRIRRGGSWNSEYRECRSSSRLGAYPLTKSNDLGFRIARTK